MKRLPESDYQILKLTDMIYDAYPDSPYKEIIKNTDFVDSTDAIIDKDEFNETMIHLERIKREALDFVEDYIHHVFGEKS